MREYIDMRRNEKVFEIVKTYIRDEFRNVEDCCGVLNPPIGSIVEISEPLETCHESAGRGLDAKRCIPPGTYRLIWVEGHYASHWGWLDPMNGESFIWFCGGYGHQITIDWRGTKKSPISPNSKDELLDKAMEGYCKLRGWLYDI